MSAVRTQPSERTRDASPSRVARVVGGPAGLEVRTVVRPPTRSSRLTMIAIELFIGVPAIPAGVGLIRNGLGLPVAWISHSLFPDYAIPGALLIVLIGGGMIAAAWITIRWPVFGGPAAIVMGSVQVAWLAIETFIVGWHGGPQGVLLGIIGVLAITLVVLGGRVTTIDRRVIAR